MVPNKAPKRTLLIQDCLGSGVTPRPILIRQHRRRAREACRSQPMNDRSVNALGCCCVDNGLLITGVFIPEGSACPRLLWLASEYKAALQIRPQDATANNALGAVLIAQGRPDQAMTYLRAATQSSANYFDARYNLGQALAASDDFNGAAEQFAAAARLRPIKPHPTIASRIRSYPKTRRGPPVQCGAGCRRRKLQACS